MANSININDKVIGKGFPCYIIAEMSANHAGDIKRAIEIIHAAKNAGADCIKIQTYTPDTLTINSDKKYFKIKAGTWKGYNIYNLYQKAFTPWEWQEKLKTVAEKEGLDFLATAYDKTSVDFLESIGIGFYKIASFEMIDIPLIKYIASKGKPILLSTGMATLDEIKEAVSTVKAQNNDDLCLLKCSSAYPAIPDDLNLRTIKHLEETFRVPAGFSDHSLGTISAVTAVAMGAKVIEKHLCISRAIDNPDASFSMEPQEFKQMVDDIRQAEKAIGQVNYDISEREKVNREFRKSIFVVDDIKKGEIFTEKNIMVIRPAYGLQPKYYEEVLGKKATKNIKRGTPLKWSMVD